MIDELAQHLQNNGVGTMAHDLFINYQPDSPDNCISLYAYAGEEPDAVLGKPGLQVRIRNVSDAAAEGIAAFVENIFKSVVNQTIGATYFLHILPRQNPEPLGRDVMGRMEYVQNFTVVYERG